jgi:two-component system, NtrC family, sensor histidine kinase PilS
LTYPWHILDFIKPAGLNDGPEFRKRVEWLMLLRLVVTSLLLGATIFLQLRESPDVASDVTLPLYILIGATFLLSLIYTLYLLIVPDLWLLSFLQVMVDLVYATVLVHFTGGAVSVFTLLYIFPILTSGILHLRRVALITASAASILFGLLMNLQFYDVIPQSNWPWVVVWSRSTPFYMVWVLVVHITSFFLVAVLSSSFSEQLQRTKASLSLKEKDFANLSDLHTSIVRSIPSGIITTDEEDSITFVNAPGAALLRTEPVAIVGESLRSVFPVIGSDRSRQPIRRQSYRTVKDVGGEMIHVELSVSDLQRNDGAARGRLVIFQDVTQIRKMEERVKLSEKQAAFVRIAAGMAHDIRNPLAALRGATEMLTTTGSSQEVGDRLLSIVMRESDRLNSLLGDFLAMVGSRKADSQRVLFTDLVEDVVDLFSRDPRVGKDIMLETLINKGLEVEGDPARLKQAVWNILTNALEASPRGSVVRVVLESDSSSGYAVLRIQDSGSGIPPEVRDRIFEPFTTTKEGGTGLGLALALTVVRDHEGTIEADSSPGGGSLFTVRIPLASTEAGSLQGEQENG